MKKKILFALCIINLAFISSCFYDNKDDLYDVIIVPGEVVPCEFTFVSFESDLVPLINQKCNACHNQNDKLGNIVLETYGQIKVFIDDGSFIGSINHNSAFEIMPPGVKLPSCDIDKFEFWVNSGAPNN